MSDVLYEMRGRAAWITLNAPENRNALSAAIIAGLDDASAARRSPTTRCAPSCSPATGRCSAPAPI